MGGSEDFPPRFPCWCRATYSWGGETKKDLGFIEGDLIEALNAGDGSWWMGRLRRDPRAIGLFPSNFVKVLDESFQPTAIHRASSQRPTDQQLSMNRNGGTFRKPFQAYDVDPRTGKVTPREATPETEKKKSKFRPYSSMKTAQAPGTVKHKKSFTGEPVDTGPRIPQPLPRGGSLTPSPARQTFPTRPSASPSPTPRYGQIGNSPNFRAPSPQQEDRAPSPALRPRSPLPSPHYDVAFSRPMHQATPNPGYHQMQYHSRAPSPAPPRDYQYYSRSPSPGAYEDDMHDAAPPPPPPAHRVAYQPSRCPSPQPGMYQQDDWNRHGSTTPIPHSPAAGKTPSPLRDAMNDVMTSLDDMGMYHNGAQHEDEIPEPDRYETNSVWSPDAFELVRKKSQQQHQRAHSAIGLNSHLNYPNEPQQRHSEYDDLDSGLPNIPPSTNKPSHLGSYVTRMEHQLRHAHSASVVQDQVHPHPPPRASQFAHARPTTSENNSNDEATYSKSNVSSQQSQQHPRHRNSVLNRTYTTKTNVTNSTESSSATQSSNSTALTSHSIMSGYSAGGFSATSAGSLARHKFGMGSRRGHARAMSAFETRSTGDINSSARSMAASETSGGSGPSYHESHASWNQKSVTPTPDWNTNPVESNGLLGGLGSPRPAKKSSFFKKMIESAKTTARTGAATARSRAESRPGSRSGSPTKSMMSEVPTGISGGTRPTSAYGASAAKEMGTGNPNGSEWMQVRRDINRSNSLSRKERDERIERCEIMDKLALRAVDLLHEMAEGDESLDGLPIAEPCDFQTSNMALVDKSTRFIQSVPPMTGPSMLAQSYVCRPYRNDVQRLRAIFTWVAERITWEEDYEGQGHPDTKRVIQTRRGSTQEIAALVRDMCNAMGLHAEVVRGYLKSPGEFLDLDTIAHANHWWNAVIIEGEWRIMDCSLANPSNPSRSKYSSASSQAAEPWYFLARPMEICYTHIPLLPEQQHIVPPVEHEILIALPCACPPYFRNNVELIDYDTGLLHLENLEMSHVHVNVPEDVECFAETEARALAQDVDGDFFETGDVVRKRALVQPEWVGGHKRYAIKALLPGDEGAGVLKIYAGKRGLMHSNKDNPHALAVALSLSHSGPNPPYEFLTRHPTPHAQRHDLYVAQPQCAKLLINNTFVFCVRQHPSSLSRFTPDTWGSTMATGGRPTSPNPMIRPGSAMSMVSASVSQSGSQYSDTSSSASGANGQGMTAAQQKPAKLAIQTPSQKIIRLTRKTEYASRPGSSGGASGADEEGLTTSWETVVKISERGVWRGLVLADRSARWCVFAEWECV
ncbi:hypothetical protein R9X50_00120300 [Acrodontium crateriforme]|uniref:SH3 domain-containing protein n=1 Tax=Acrodontium crateriforme TaxID=150365 RepID=A0AAQ3LYP1_9PEZI|nr:hypothetical protein R9X50_00120300 [Acrodontium crateriforme]